MTARTGISETSYQELPERSRRVLAGLVKQYIKKGEPVSSLWLTQPGRFQWSSATVRNVMVKLEKLGYVYQPHTSAGRVPTDKGYRAYVDLLLDSYRSTDKNLEVEARLRQAGTVSDILTNVSHELSRASHQLGFALMPPPVGTLHHIKFVPLEGTRVLVIVSTKSQQVSHKTVDLGVPMTTSELQHGANYLNSEFAGLPLWDARAAIVEQLRQQRMLYNQLLSRALRLASSTLEDLVPQNKLFIEGAELLLDEVSGVDAQLPFTMLRSLFNMIEQKDQLVLLLNEYIEGPGLTVVIGAEHASPRMKNFSLVMSTYSDGRSTGRIGVIGARRMSYSRAITAVDNVSRAVNRILVAT